MKEFTQEELADEEREKYQNHIEDDYEEELSECCGALILDNGLCSDCYENC